MPDLRDKLQDALGNKYRIVRELTGGGMSRVFLAQDERLQRDVVAKVLSPDLVDEARIERFRQEVLQTARLQHPTIVPVIEVGAIEDVPTHHIPYYVMPYIRGESLRSRMHHEGQLSLSLTMRVMRSVFDALAYAHAHGVVHRDIKPENVFLSGSNAVLADFGIAKAIAGPGADTGVTAPGLAVGTPSYMAPEQLVDPEHVGPRADLYSAGVVAFEMLSGRLPWGARTPVEMLASRAGDRVTPLRSLRPDVPQPMAAVIEQCLAWAPERRPESALAALHALESVPVTQTPDTADAIARELTAEQERRRPDRPRTRVLIMGALGLVLVAALGRTLWPSGPRAVSLRKVAVLYPELPADTRAREDLAERLFHSLTATLAPVSGLRLVGMVTVSQLADRGLSNAQIADSISPEGADVMLALKATPSTEGSVALTIESRGATGAAADRVAGPLTVSALARVSPDSLATLVRRLAAQSLTKLKLGTATHAVSETERIDAYTAWLTARDAQALRTPAGLRTAVTHFERAAALDSTWAQPRADLSQTYALALFYHYRLDEPPYAVAARAVRLAEQAIRLEPQFADGYLAHGLIGTFAGQPVHDIAADFANVATLLSANPYSQTWNLHLLAKQGKYDDAVQRAEEEVALDPRSTAPRIASATYALAAGQYVTAVRNASAARPRFPDVPMVAQLEIIARLRLGGQAVQDCAAVPARPYLGVRALCLEAVGRKELGRATSDTLLAVLTGKVPMDSTFDVALFDGEMALYSAAHGDDAAARQWLKQVFADSPVGIDYRVIRSGIFTPAQIAYADSLQSAAWSRVSAMAAVNARRGRALLDTDR